jgi:hypothetical protein
MHCVGAALRHNYATGRVGWAGAAFFGGIMLRNLNSAARRKWLMISQ